MGTVLSAWICLLTSGYRLGALGWMGGRKGRLGAEGRTLAGFSRSARGSNSPFSGNLTVRNSARENNSRGTMGDERSEFQTALDAVRAGSPDAVSRLIEVYGPHIRRVVRRRLDQRLRSKFDSLDFVQMVWASFFRDPAEIGDLRQPEDLIRYLSGMARNKLISEHRRRIKTRKYDVQRELPLHDAQWERQQAQRGPPTPSQVAMARERWERLLHDQPERDRQIMQLRAQGVTYVEIGRQLGIHERTVREVIRRLSRTP
jgi:RNA polymerase sigma factor (sigma-70 family)